MIDFVDKHDLWVYLCLNIVILGTFYFKFIRMRYLEEAQLLNLFYRKKEIDDKVDKVEKAVTNSATYKQLEKLEDLVKEFNQELKSEYLRINNKLDDILIRERK